jgi:SpoVK/Ycf46/Vps4 family AAA+-type ATPase
MKAMPVMPNCILQTIAPNEDFRRIWEELIGVEELKQKLLTHMRICFSKFSLFSWYNKHHSNSDYTPPKYYGRVLLVGAPGTGKTSIAKACTDEFARLTQSQVYFLELGLVRGKYVGESARNVEKAFEYIRELSLQNRVVLFIDEFDTVAATRSFEEMHDDIRAMVNTLIREMDKTKSSNVFIIAASNLERHIDHAVKRRFDLILYFQRPDLVQRKELLSSLLRQYGIPLWDVYTLAKKTDGYTQDDLVRIVNAAVEKAFAEDSPLALKHLLRALEEFRPTGGYDE